MQFFDKHARLRMNIRIFFSQSQKRDCKKATIIVNPFALNCLGTVPCSLRF